MDWYLRRWDQTDFALKYLIIVNMGKALNSFRLRFLLLFFWVFFLNPGVSCNQLHLGFGKLIKYFD